MTALQVSPAPPSSTVFRTVARFLSQHRVPISLVVFTALIAEDVLEGLRPHDLLNCHDAHSMLGLGLIIVGVLLRTWAAGTIHKATRLTTSGPYRAIRNPLYVGSFLIMIGLCVVIDDAENIWFVLGPIALIYYLKVREEERRLAARFGEAWNRYARNTPRYLPRRWVWPESSEWNLRQWLGNREHKAFAATLLGLTALEFWSWGVLHI